ncbi:hypothetical protein imdm_2351 [gamma proteobacterium IMCC2047]|nr:hypothetical protein imdm_2351 [gamma proteobacterium IMCC2047]
MLTKILITALVIAACFAYLRYQRGKNTATSGQTTDTPSTGSKPTLSSQFHWLAGGLILLTATAAIGFFIYNWMDNHQVMTVNIINPNSGDKVSYQVYKGDLQEHSFKTLKGQTIRISSAERIEISEAP